MKVYNVELAVASQSISVSAGQVLTSNIASKASVGYFDPYVKFTAVLTRHCLRTRQLSGKLVTLTVLQEVYLMQSKVFVDATRYSKITMCVCDYSKIETMQ